mgnify:CR=1 FL=1
MKIHHFAVSTKDNPERPYRYVAAFGLARIRTDHIREWCYDTYGWPGYLPNTHEIRWRDSLRHGEIEFSREEDLTLFLLKWST